MIQKLNESMNLIASALIFFGGLLALKDPHTGQLIVTAAIGALGGNGVARLAGRSTDNKTSPDGQKESQ